MSLFFVMLSCTIFAQSDIKEGIGVDNFILHQTTFKEVVDKLGKPDSIYIKTDSLTGLDLFRPKVARYDYPWIVHQYVYECKQKGIRFIYELYSEEKPSFEDFKGV